MEIIRIHEQQKAPPVRHENFGSEYQVCVTPTTARRLCGMYPVPEIGCETVVAIVQTDLGFKYRLQVANIGGQVVVRSSAMTVDQWPDVFRVQVIKKS